MELGASRLLKAWHHHLHQQWELRSCWKLLQAAASIQTAGDNIIGTFPKADCCLDAEKRPNTMHISSGKDDIRRWRRVLQLLNIGQLLLLHFKFGFGCKRKTQDYIGIRTDTRFSCHLTNNIVVPMPDVPLVDSTSPHYLNHSSSRSVLCYHVIKSQFVCFCTTDTWVTLVGQVPLCVTLLQMETDDLALVSEGRQIRSFWKLEDLDNIRRKYWPEYVRIILAKLEMKWGEQWSTKKKLHVNTIFSYTSPFSWLVTFIPHLYSCLAAVWIKD